DHYFYVSLLLNHPSTPHVYTLSLHDALPISSPTAAKSTGTSLLIAYGSSVAWAIFLPFGIAVPKLVRVKLHPIPKTKSQFCSMRSEEHTSELLTSLSRMPSSA